MTINIENLKKMPRLAVLAEADYQKDLRRLERLAVVITGLEIAWHVVAIATVAMIAWIVFA